jgi:Chaperone of endosialidase
VKMQTRVALIVAFLAACRAWAQQAVPTTFTYQGKLTDGGQPANGTYDLRFRLYTAATGGTSLGSDNCRDNVQVADGLVTASLDFGDVFASGQDRWLEVAVRADATVGNCSGGTYTTLTPRQELTGAPTSVGLRLPFNGTATSPYPVVMLQNFGTGQALFGVASTDRQAITGWSGGLQGTGVFGQNNTYQSTGALGQGRYGVVGLSEVDHGVVGQTYGTQSAGVFGTSSTGMGVYGLTDSNSATNYAIYGETHSPAGYAGYFLGRGYFSDNVGINVQQPSVPLQVTGGSDLSLAAGGNLVLGGIGSANLVMDNNEIQARSSGAAAALFINANGGNVGIGTNNAQGFQLAVNGPAAKPGGGSWSTLSDERVKRNVQPLAGALDKLLRLRGVTFEYIDPASINELPGVHTGMVAQEVEKVAPEWVTAGPSGLKSVGFSGFEALTVEALRELRDRTGAAEQADRSRIAALEQENRDLRRELEDLRTAVRALAAQRGSTAQPLSSAR